MTVAGGRVDDEPVPARTPLRPVVIVNPIRHQAEQASALLSQRMAEVGWPEPLILMTTEADPGDRQAREAIRFGADAVVVVGGDGTLRAVVHELVQPGIVDRGILLGVIPLGTANLFARNVGLYPATIEQAVEHVVRLRARRLDVGQAIVTFRADDGELNRSETFLVVCGLGRDARTVAKVPEGLKHTVGWVGYLTPAAMTMMAHRLRMTIQIDDAEPHDVMAWSVLAVNLGLLPAGVHMTTGSRGDDGILETLIVRPDRPWHWARIAAKGLWNLRHDVPGLTQVPARLVTVQPVRPQPLQLDGDVIEDVIRLQAGVREQALRVLVP